MENTNINETQTTNATQTESGEKLFTQEQVNQIVSERLARERSKAATEQATTDREKALDAREQALKCRELVAGDKKYPAKLLDVLDTASFDSFKAQADKLLEAFPHMGDTFMVKGANTATPPFTKSEPDENELIRKAFLKK